VSCRPVETEQGQRTPDFVIALPEPVVWEVKQIEPNRADRAELSRFGVARLLGKKITLA
jgi:hypothetical protein